MEKNYTELDYLKACSKANKEGKKVQLVQKEVEYDVEVLEYEKKLIEVEIYNEETGEPTGETKLVEVDDLDKPIMVQEEIENPETGEKELVTVQKHHTETRTKTVQELTIEPDGYYICREGNITDGTLNPDFEAEKAHAEKERIANLKLTSADVERGIYKAKGMDFKDITALLQNDPPVGLDLKELNIELKANHFYRGNPYVNAVGTLLGFTEEMLDKFFETNDYTYLLPSEQVEDETDQVSEQVTDTVDVADEDTTAE